MTLKSRFTVFFGVAVVLALALAPATSYAVLSTGISDYTIDLTSSGLETGTVASTAKVTNIDVIDFFGKARIFGSGTGGGGALVTGDTLTVQGIFRATGFTNETGPLSGGAAGTIDNTPPSAGGAYLTDGTRDSWEITGWFSTTVELTGTSLTTLDWKHDPTGSSFLTINLDGDTYDTSVFTPGLKGNLADAAGITDGTTILSLSDTAAAAALGNYDFSASSGRDVGIFSLDSGATGILKANDGTDLISNGLLTGVRTDGNLTNDDTTPTMALEDGFDDIFGAASGSTVVYFTEDGTVRLIPEATSLAIWSLLVVGGICHRRRSNS